MKTIKKTVEITENHTISISLPEDITGKYAEVLIHIKDNDEINKTLISENIKSISGIIQTDKSYKELKDEIIVAKLNKYENIP